MVLVWSVPHTTASELNKATAQYPEHSEFSEHRVLREVHLQHTPRILGHDHGSFLFHPCRFLDFVASYEDLAVAEISHFAPEPSIIRVNPRYPREMIDDATEIREMLSVVLVVSIAINPHHTANPNCPRRTL